MEDKSAKKHIDIHDHPNRVFLMPKKRPFKSKSPSQLGSSLRRIQSALEEWEGLQKNCKTEGHPADLKKKTSKLLRELKDQIDELNL